MDWVLRNAVSGSVVRRQLERSLTVFPHGRRFLQPPKRKQEDDQKNRRSMNEKPRACNRFVDVCAESLAVANPNQMLALSYRVSPPVRQNVTRSSRFPVRKNLRPLPGQSPGLKRTESEFLSCSAMSLAAASGFKATRQDSRATWSQRRSCRGLLPPTPWLQQIRRVREPSDFRQKTA